MERSANFASRRPMRHYAGLQSVRMEIFGARQISPTRSDACRHRANGSESSPFPPQPAARVASAPWRTGDCTFLNTTPRRSGKSHSHRTSAGFAVSIESVSCAVGGASFKGALAYESEVAGRRPLPLTAPDLMGVRSQAIARMRRLIRRKYADFVADMAGDGVSPSGPEEAGARQPLAFRHGRKTTKDRSVAKGLCRRSGSGSGTSREPRRRASRRDLLYGFPVIASKIAPPSSTSLSASTGPSRRWSCATSATSPTTTVSTGNTRRRCCRPATSTTGCGRGGEGAVTRRLGR